MIVIVDYEAGNLTSVAAAAAAAGFPARISSDPADIATATNYITQGIGELASGKPLSQATTRAYGCSIKYSNAG